MTHPRAKTCYLKRIARTGVMLETTSEGTSKNSNVMASVPTFIPAKASQFIFTGA
jgi:hypothetical protein